MNEALEAHPLIRQAAATLDKLPVENRWNSFRVALTFSPESFEEQLMSAGPMRAAFALYWESTTGKPLPHKIVSETMVRDFDLLRDLFPMHSEFDGGRVVQLFVTVVDLIRPHVDAWQNYVQQMKRLSCPGCGDDGCGF